MTLRVNLRASLEAVETGSNNFGIPSFTPVMQFIAEMENGTSAYQNDMIWFSEGRTLAASGYDDFDLAGGLTDAFGQTMTFAKTTGFFLTVNPTSTGGVASGSIAIGAAPSNTYLGYVSGPAQSIRPIQAGGTALLMNTDATAFSVVTAGTGDIFRITNLSAVNPTTYNIAIIGRSA